MPIFRHIISQQFVEPLVFDILRSYPCSSSQQKLPGLAEESVANFVKLKRSKFSFHFVSSHHLLLLLLIPLFAHLPLPSSATGPLCYYTTSRLKRLSRFFSALTRNSAVRLQKPVRNCVPSCSHTCQATPTRCRELHVVSNWMTATHTLGVRSCNR